MDPNRAIQVLTDEIITHFRLPKKICYKFIYTRVEWAFGIGFDLGRRFASNRGKAVVQMDMHGNFIDTHSTIKEAANKVGTDKQRISDAVRGVTRSSGGYTWRYFNPNDYYKYKQVKKQPES